MAFHENWFYVANTDSIVRFKYKSGQTTADSEPEKLVELTPGGYNQHWTRNILFSPDGKLMFVSIGSATNVDVEADAKRAAISVYDPNGKDHRIYRPAFATPSALRGIQKQANFGPLSMSGMASETIWSLITPPR